MNNTNINKRGPKPNKNPCIECKNKPPLCRGYCSACYARLINQGKIQTLPIDPFPIALTDTQKSVLTGLMLGDGCLYRREKTHNPYLTVCRSSVDKNYLLWQYYLFAEFCKRKPVDYTIYDNRTKMNYHGCKFTTRRIPLFNEWYDKWYPNGKKTIPDDLQLDPLSLAIWFCDDGHIKNTCSKWRFRLKLSTDGFSENDVEKLISILEKRYNYIFNKYKNGDHFRIDVSGDAARAFVREIDPTIPEVMSRKIIWRDPECKIYENLPASIGNAYKRTRGVNGRFIKDEAAIS